MGQDPSFLRTREPADLPDTHADSARTLAQHEHVPLARTCNSTCETARFPARALTRSFKQPLAQHGQLHAPPTTNPHSKLKSIARSPRHYYLLHKGQLKPRVTRPISVQQVLVMPLWHGPGAQLLSTTTTHAATTHGEDRTSDGAPHHLSRAQTRQRNRSVIISHKAHICPAAKTKLARAQAGTRSFDRRE